MSRQSKSIARIRAERRDAGLCVVCAARSKTYRCDRCAHPYQKLKPKARSESARRSARARWSK